MEYVKVSDGNISIEIETEKDGSLLMDNIKSAFQSIATIFEKHHRSSFFKILLSRNWLF